MKKLTFFVAMLALSLSIMAQQDYTETAFGINMRMVYVEGGTFTMGCTFDYGCEQNEQPNRRTSVSSFYIGMLEVTQSQWEQVMGDNIPLIEAHINDKYNKIGFGAEYPVCYVNWEDAKEFCTRLSRKTGKSYSLPTEAEWEYAARGGKKNKKNEKFSGSDEVSDVAIRGEGAKMCGTKRPNVLGLFDMSGNVSEWCEDWYGENYLQYDNTDPKGPSQGKNRVHRGGSWGETKRISARSGEWPKTRNAKIGFRVVVRESKETQQSVAE